MIGEINRLQESFHPLPDGNNHQLNDIEQEHHTSASSSPVVIHCSAGVGRTGTYATIDICCQQLKKTGKANIVETVHQIRRQRDAMVQVSQQYEFCYKAVLKFAESLSR